MNISKKGLRNLPWASGEGHDPGGGRYCLVEEQLKLSAPSREVGVLTIFDRTKRPHKEKLRVFMDSKGYITQLYSPAPGKSCWSKACLDNLAMSEHNFSDSEQRRLLEQWKDRQNRIRYCYLELLHQRMETERQALFDSLPELPEGLEEWRSKVLMENAQYGFYQAAGRGKTQVQCSCCGNSFRALRPAPGLLHNRQAINCTACGKRLRLVMQRRNGLARYQFRAFLVLQKTAECLVVREFNSVRRIYFPFENGSEATLLPAVDEVNLHGVYFFDLANGRLKRSYFRYSKRGEWLNGIWHNNYGSCFCPLGLEDSLQSTAWAYRPYARLAQAGTVFNTLSAIVHWQPEMEYLIKAGLFRLAVSCAYTNFNLFNKSGKSALERMRLDAFNYRLALRFDVNASQLLFLQTCTRYGIKPEDEVFAAWGECAPAHLFHLFKEVPPLGLLRYLQGQRGKLKVLVGLYYDYIEMSRKLSRDGKIQMWPRNLPEAHDLAAANFNAEVNAEKNKQLIAVASKWQALEVENDEFIMRLPRSGHDLYMEGQAQHNCVGSYTDRIIKGDSLVLFLRRRQAPEAAFGTIELSPKSLRILQTEGRCHTALPTDAANFLRWYEKKILTPLREGRRGDCGCKNSRACTG